MTSQVDEAALDKDTAADSNTPKPKVGRDPKLVERDEILARMDAQIEQRRKDEYNEFLRSADVDPRAAALAVAMEREARGERIETDPAEPVVADAQQVEDATPVEPMAEPAARKAANPLDQFVSMVDGKPMFRTVVHGQEKLIPLERAQAELQKVDAGNERLRQAAEARKALEAREAALRKTEQQLQARGRAPTPAVDDRALDKEAVELVRSLVTESEDKAAARLAKTLKTIRGSAPTVDAAAIARQAADEAVRTIAARDNERALQGGFKQFTKDYPDIAADSDLFAIADRKTTAIAEEHPEWDPGQVMLEAGRQTREWLKGMGAPVRGAPPAGEQPNNRQQRKQTLVPMPRPSSARVPAATEEPSQSTADVVAEMRKARGQPYT